MSGMEGPKKRKITDLFLSVNATDHARTTDEAQQGRPAAASAETEAQPNVRNEATASSDPFDNLMQQTPNHACVGRYTARASLRCR